MPTKIEWAEESWNPIIGCSHCSPGCDHCYAERMAARHACNPLEGIGGAYGIVVTDGKWNGRTMFNYGQFRKPFHWKKPRRIFVCSMSDLFHETVELAWLDLIMGVIEHNPRHAFIILTKRPERAAEYFVRYTGLGLKMPPNLWVGITVCNQAEADAKIPILLDIPATVRFVSVEPMLGGIDFAKVVLKDGDHLGPTLRNLGMGVRLDLVICGGETGPGARPMHPDWARSLRDQCVAAGVPFFFKHWGEWIHPSQVINPEPLTIEHRVKSKLCRKYEGPIPEKPNGHWPMNVFLAGKKAAGRLLDGREWNEMPKGSE